MPSRGGEILTPEEITASLRCHEQSLKALQHQINEIKNITKELAEMNMSLTQITSELKYTNTSINDHGKRIEYLESVPKNRVEKLIGSVLSALGSGAVGYLLAQFIN